MRPRNTTVNTLLSPNTETGGIKQARARGYAYSFDRDTFRGCHPTRAEAVAAGEEALTHYNAPVEAIWVGRIAENEPPVDLLGEMVIDEINDRQSEDGQESIHAGEAARDDLDARLSALLKSWMDDHGLLPARGVESVSEHAIAVKPHVDQRGDVGKEVSLIGDVG